MTLITLEAFMTCPEAPFRVAFTHSFLIAEETHKLPLGDWKFCTSCLIAIIELFQSAKYCCHSFRNNHRCTQETNDIWTSRDCPSLCCSCDYTLRTDKSSLFLRITADFINRATQWYNSNSWLAGPRFAVRPHLNMKLSIHILNARHPSL
jgi:hypothetical protein